MEERACPECGKPVFGRIDKKFCSDACRNAFNNKANAPRTNHMRNVNNILARNRRILKELNPNGKMKTHKDKLLKKGFDFEYFTNQYLTKNGDTYHFVYEQGYLMLEEGFVLLVERKDDRN
jgi:predicted nucleic acid-binding Zn ribbon protein